VAALLGLGDGSRVTLGVGSVDAVGRAVAPATPVGVDDGRGRALGPGDSTAAGAS
jgi:hypothetical protein